MRQRSRYAWVWVVVLSWAGMGTPGTPGPAVPRAGVPTRAAPGGGASEYEVAVGRSAARELEQRYGLCQDEKLNARVRRAAAPLVRVCGSRTPIVIRVLNSDEPNGVALPGGFIFVTQGLLRILSEEDLLSAALGHEVAHIALGHMTEMLREYMNARMPRSEENPEYPQATGSGVPEPPNALPPRLEAPKRASVNVVHEREKEADRAAARYLRAVGIDPRAVVRLLIRLSEQPELDASNSETHPTWPERIRSLEEYLNSPEFRNSGPRAPEALPPAYPRGDLGVPWPLQAPAR